MLLKGVLNIFYFLLRISIVFYPTLSAKGNQPTVSTSKGLQCSLVPLHLANAEPWQEIVRREESKIEVYILLALFLKGNLEVATPLN